MCTDLPSCLSVPRTQHLPAEMKFDSTSNPPSFNVPGQPELVIVKGVKLRCRLIGTRVDATEIVSTPSTDLSLLPRSSADQSFFPPLLRSSPSARSKTTGLGSRSQTTLHTRTTTSRLSRSRPAPAYFPRLPCTTPPRLAFPYPRSCLIPQPTCRPCDDS